MTRDWMDGIASRSISLLQPSASSVRSVPVSTGSRGTSKLSFREVLANTQGTSGNLKLSSHAVTRMAQRGIQLSAGDWSKVEQAVTKAAEKGSKEAYVVYGNSGFVVNIPNQTVVTAMLNHDETVVTNIDSVVIVPGPDR